MEAGGPEQPRGQGAGRHQGAGHDGRGGRRQLLRGGEAVDMSGQGSCQEVSRSLGEAIFPSIIKMMIGTIQFVQEYMGNFQFYIQQKLENGNRFIVFLL